MFLTLPPRDELPDYYEFTKLPIAIDNIEDKIHDGGYSSITEIESDFKRMVQNAKDYNATGSEIFEDAERIRKLVYNYMKTHNPAYTENPNYASFPTPIPKPGEKQLNGASRRMSATPGRQTKSKAPGSSEPPDTKASVVADAADGGATEHESGVNFRGLSFQDAQFAIIDALLKTTDEEYVSHVGRLHVVAVANISKGDWKFSHRSPTYHHESSRTITSSSGIQSRSRRCESVSTANMDATNILASPTLRHGMLSRKK
jgi:hypothetical protein